MKFLLIGLMLTLSGMSFACTEDGKEGIMPENDMNIPADVKSINGITEEKFNAVIDKIEAIYSPIVDSMGGKLFIERSWSDGTVNAYARRSGKAWMVNMFGGLARHDTITEDGFALVLCHEIGHHLGGAPKAGMFLNRWASNEGQSDYFATLKCLRQTFINDNNAEIIAKMEVPAALSSACQKAHPNKVDSDICIRNGMAGKSVSDLFAAMRSLPAGKFDTPDTSVVRKTDNKHPAHQCRLDTYFQGALCEKSMSEEVSQKDEVKGTCHGSTGHTVGLRPLCWFKPNE